LYKNFIRIEGYLARIYADLDGHCFKSQLGVVDQKGGVPFDEAAHVMPWGIRCARGKRERKISTLKGMVVLCR
jgi:hypothetical protein